MPTLVADNMFSTGTTAPVFYSDDSALEVCVLEYDVSAVGNMLQCNMTLAPQSLEAISTPFPSAGDADWVLMQQVRLLRWVGFEKLKGDSVCSVCKGFEYVPRKCSSPG